MASLQGGRDIQGKGSNLARYTELTFARLIFFQPRALNCTAPRAHLVGPLSRRAPLGDRKLDIVMSILDPNWKYTHSTATDIRKTFAKARQKLAQSKASQRPNTPEPNVAPLVRRERRPALRRVISLAFVVRGLTLRRDPRCGLSFTLADLVQ